MDPNPYESPTEPGQPPRKTETDFVALALWVIAILLTAIAFAPPVYQ
jgi:hypothetical protein